MADEPDNIMLRLLRDVRDGQGRMQLDITALRRQVGEMHESTITALGLAGHANIRHDSVRLEIDALKERVARLEERVAD